MISKASEIYAELDRILETKWLRESYQLSSLLRHLVEETLAGRAEGLKEYSLGLKVFNRPSDYDPRTDAIVRVQASVLRKRLAAYYENEGRESTLRICIPKGRYVPEFQEVEPANKLGPDLAIVGTVPGKRRIGSFAGGIVAGMLLAVCAMLLLRGTAETTNVECPALWAGFLDPRIETIASFGVPLFFAGGEGLFVRDTQVNRLTDDAGQIDRIGEILGRGFRPQEDVYTGVGDAIGTHYVARWLDGRKIPVSVANSNYIGLSDIEQKNLIVVSSARFQTLLEQMALPNHFLFNGSEPGGGFTLMNALPGEQSAYEPQRPGTGVNNSYAVVSLWPGRPASRRIMYLSGIETWATQGAAQFVLDPERMADLQKRLNADPPEGPRGRKSPFFQVLLRVEGRHNRVHAVSYVTHRYLPESF
ncbi:MAG: hypothetical protein ACK5AZ_19220 [Bryobacteraceae bacterium]